MHAYSLRSIPASLSVVSVHSILQTLTLILAIKYGILHGSLHARLFQYICIELENIGIWDITVVSELSSCPAVGLRNET